MCCACCVFPCTFFDFQTTPISSVILICSRPLSASCLPLRSRPLRSFIFPVLNRTQLRLCRSLRVFLPALILLMLEVLATQPFWSIPLFLCWLIFLDVFPICLPRSLTVLFLLLLCLFERLPLYLCNWAASGFWMQLVATSDMWLCSQNELLRTGFDVVPIGFPVMCNRAAANFVPFFWSRPQSYWC